MDPVTATAPRESEAESARRRGSIYGLLARFFRREPDARVVGGLREPGVFESLVEAGMCLDRAELIEPPVPDVVETLAADYTALFLAPSTRIPLNESVHRPEDGSLLGESTLQVKECLRTLGLRIDERWGDLPDHLSIELEIMQWLAEGEADHRGSAAPEVANELAVRQEAFLDGHLVRWVPDLCDRIEARAVTRFYGEVARVTRAFVLADARRARGESGA
jgi:TorA maturation chaperone TorD